MMNKLRLSAAIRVADPFAFNKQRRWISLLHKTATSSKTQQQDLDYAVCVVRDHDPAGFLPGRLLPEIKMQIAYYAVRSFWVETGLRFGSTAKVPANATPCEHLDYWKQGIDIVFDSEKEDLSDEWNHPSLRLLQSILQQEVPWTKQHFDDILDGRRKDIDVKQYESMKDLIRHAEQSCGSLSQLVLESGSILPETSPAAHEAARLVGVCHGITNALRTSIPVISTTGKLIIPAELTEKYGIKSPRYLLSALGQGDVKSIQALNSAVQEIAQSARDHLRQARGLREAILSEPGGSKAVSVLLPGLASETFLNRLQESRFQLTDRNLRNVGFAEHFVCASRMVLAYYRQTY